jgi:glycosyltransferase involved in cell wall biosynthesis
MKISIITPSYNSAPWIERAIKSALSQDYADWEHIIVDGGSSDNTLEVLEKYQHLKWISKPDKGIYDAMNKGIKMSEGDWLFFMGADDYFIDEQVLSDVFINENLGYGIIYGNVTSPRWNHLYDGEFDKIKILDKNICHQAIFFNRSVFQKVGMFNLRYRAQADWDLNLKLFLNPKIEKKYINRVIAYYEDGGFSSGGDLLFSREKSIRITKHGMKVLPISVYKKHLKKAISYYKEEGKLIQFVLSNMVLLKIRLIEWK